MNDLGFMLSIVLFYLTFAWLYSMRTSQYPFLSRFPLVDSYKSIHLKIIIYAYIFILFWIVLSSIAFYLYFINVKNNIIVSLLIGPVIYFFAPHIFSWTVTALIMWKFPGDPLLKDPKYSFEINLSHITKPLNSKIFFYIGLLSSVLLLFFLPILLIMLN